MAKVEQPVRQVEVVDRQEFIQRRFRHRMGEHVTLIGKTQSGKTTLAFQLLDKVTTPALQAIVLVMKPRDAVPAEWMDRLGYRRTRHWPPLSSSRFVPKRPRGWVLWPKLGNIDRDNAVLRTEFRNALSDSYSNSARRRTGGRIIFADEVVGLTQQLKLGDELDAIWMRGSSMHLGLWVATQRPFHAPLHAYNAATHLFLHRDEDRRNVDRYRDIGGVDPDLVRDIVGTMDLHQFLYIRKTDHTMCIVDA